MYLLGIDIGSSSIKVSLVEANSGKQIATAISPKKEMDMIAHQQGWAEQNPTIWWDNIKVATSEIISKVRIDIADIKAIGISYQMHGLVIVDQNQEVLRPSIIWCDSRAVTIGEKAFKNIGEEKALSHLLNSPGNFTASKLKWVQENEPEIYAKIHKFMLPGDFIAMKMTGEITTTASGLSEGILWDCKENKVADIVLKEYGIDAKLVPNIVDTFSVQGSLSEKGAKELGLAVGTKICYRGGDQPNNALSLNVLQPGEVAATAGTSGVIYGVLDKPKYDPKSRVNTFVHVNHSADHSRFGVLLCINGTGILNSWVRKLMSASTPGSSISYQAMNDLAMATPAGSEGLLFMPFGNGSERTLQNVEIGAMLHGLKFNTHTPGHMLRAAQEGIVYALNYGFDIMSSMGVKTEVVRAGEANMFLSPLFREAFATITGAVVELYNTDGAQGAARGAGIGAGIYSDFKEAFHGLHKTMIVEPNQGLKQLYQDSYQNWTQVLNKNLS